MPLEGYSGEEYLQALADRRFTVCCGPVLRPKARTSQRGWPYSRALPLCAQGDVERAAQQLLKDFRTGRLGRVCLELPPQAE